MMNEVLPCPSCSANMFLVACSSSRSPTSLYGAVVRAESIRIYEQKAFLATRVKREMSTDYCARTLSAECGHCVQFVDTVCTLQKVSVICGHYPRTVPGFLDPADVIGSATGILGALWGSRTTSQF